MAFDAPSAPLEAAAQQPREGFDEERSFATERRGGGRGRGGGNGEGDGLVRHRRQAGRPDGGVRAWMVVARASIARQRSIINLALHVTAHCGVRYCSLLGCNVL